MKRLAFVIAGLLLVTAAATPDTRRGFERFLQENGFEKITGIFSAYPSATKYTAPHVRETHDRIVADSTNTVNL